MKIKKEQNECDDEIEETILPMPIVVPKTEPGNIYTPQSDLAPHATDSGSHRVHIKLEPNNCAENLESIESPEDVVPLPLPLIDVKKEQIENTIEDGEIIETDRYSANSNDNTDIEPPKKERKKHKRKKGSKELNEARKTSSKRSHNTSDSDNDSFRSEISNRLKTKKKRKNDESLIPVIPLVKDYNHTSINENENLIPHPSKEIILPKPKVIKVEPRLLLPKPILEAENSNSHRNFPKIKLENQALPNWLPNSIEKVLTRCSKIIHNMKVHEKNIYTKQNLYTRINFIEHRNSSNIENRSPLLYLKNVQYKFSSSTKINYSEFGIISPPDTVAKLARITGYEAGKLLELIASNGNYLNITPKNDGIISLTKASTFSSFYTNVSTQTDQIPCDKCVIRQLNKCHNISVQASPSTIEIGVQTEREDELPMIREFHNLNMNQQLALNDIYSIIISGQPSNANDKLKIRDRLMQIYDMAVMESLIVPQAPIIPNYYNPVSQLPSSHVDYQIPSSSNFREGIYNPYYNQRQPNMFQNNYQQEHLNSQQMTRYRETDPRNKPARKTNDPRNKTNNSSNYQN